MLMKPTAMNSKFPSSLIPFRERLQPAVRNGGFRMKDSWIWCGSVGKGEDGRYHMFASCWSKEVPFLPNWITSCEVVRASADRPEGPYEFEEVVLPARSGFWDGTMTHNPTLHYHDGTWILYHIGLNIELDGSDAPIRRPLLKNGPGLPRPHRSPGPGPGGMPPLWMFVRMPGMRILSPIQLPPSAPTDRW